MNCPALVSVVLLLSSWSGMAAAADQAASPIIDADVILKRMDRDNDGKVSLEEYRNALSRRFHALDADMDGVLRADEIPREWLEVSDADISGDGLNLQELSAHLQPVFQGFDLDRDGRLDRDELAGLAQARAQRLEKAP